MLLLLQVLCMKWAVLPVCVVVCSGNLLEVRHALPGKLAVSNVCN
jgi:hypothetical protein